MVLPSWGGTHDRAASEGPNSNSRSNEKGNSDCEGSQLSVKFHSSLQWCFWLFWRTELNTIHNEILAVCNHHIVLHHAGTEIKNSLIFHIWITLIVCPLIWQYFAVSNSAEHNAKRPGQECSFKLLLCNHCFVIVKLLIEIFIWVKTGWSHCSMSVRRCVCVRLLSRPGPARTPPPPRDAQEEPRSRVPRAAGS